MWVPHQPPAHESALGTGSHNPRVLQDLSSHQPEYFGPQIVLAIAPADAAASDRPGAQVETLEAG